MVRRASGGRWTLCKSERKLCMPENRAPRSHNLERGDCSLQRALERNLSAELDNAPGEKRVGHPEVRISKAQVHALNLRMVKSVKGFQTQFEVAITRFVDQEVLEQRQVPVIT